MASKNEQDRFDANVASIEEMGLLHDEDQYSEMTGAPKIPPPNATADAVRDYLVRLLRSHGLGIDYARRVAARWTVGSGKELRTYPMAMYVNIFGRAQDGWVIYYAVKTEHLREKGKGDMSFAGRLSLAIAGLLLTFALGFLGANIQSGLNVLAWTAMAFGVMGTFFLFIWTFDNPTPEETVEKELRENWLQKPGDTAGTGTASDVAAPAAAPGASSSGNDQPAMAQTGN